MFGREIADTTIDGLTAIDVADRRRLSPQGERNVDSAWIILIRGIPQGHCQAPGIDTLMSATCSITPTSATFSVTEGSDDLFFDAL